MELPGYPQCWIPKSHIGACTGETNGQKTKMNSKPSRSMRRKMIFSPKREGIMAKKTIIEKFKEFLDASSAESNEPMTGGEIATAKANNKSKAAAKKRSSKSTGKTKTAPKKAKKKTKKAKRG
jgi:hypothetical protein